MRVYVSMLTWYQVFGCVSIGIDPAAVSLLHTRHRTSALISDYKYTYCVFYFLKGCVECLLVTGTQHQRLLTPFPNGKAVSRGCGCVAVTRYAVRPVRTGRIARQK